MPNDLTLLSVIIPARNEQDALPSTVEHLFVELRRNGIPHEIVVVDDGSTDGTWDLATRSYMASKSAPGMRFAS